MESKLRMVTVTKIINERDEVVAEFQSNVLNEQEHHPHRTHHTHLPSDNPPKNNNQESSNEGSTEIPTTIDLSLSLELQDIDYSGNDFMVRVCANANDGFNGGSWLVNDGGWYKSKTHHLSVPIQDDKKYFIRIACATIPANDNIYILENGVVASNWVKEIISNGQLAVYTKGFIGVDAFPNIVFKN
jgi:hypothetical protein